MARRKLRLGFSLVELMAAVGIVSILVSLALPRFRAFIARARTSEAKMNLGIIYGLQQTYKAEFEKYATFSGMGYNNSCGAENNELGFRVTDCSKLLYFYKSSAGGGDADSKGSKIYPNCTEKDQWSINVKRKLTHDRSAIEHCKD